jgi:flagellin FlaB
MVKRVRKLAWKKKNNATIGIGTLIVFIALVLVAAIASAVILKTAYSLKDAAERTGQAATSEVSAGIKILDIVGDRGNPLNANIQVIRFTCTVWQGSNGIDIKTLRVHWVGPAQGNIYLNLDPANPLATSNILFGASDSNANINDGWNPPGSCFLLNGNIIYIEIDLSAAKVNDALGPGKTASVYFEPSAGLVVEESFTTPNSYGSNQYIDLTSQ